jgi:hypothetical protein
MFLQQEIYPTNDRSVPPQARDLELLEGARLSKQIAARAQVFSWHSTAAANVAGMSVAGQSRRSAAGFERKFGLSPSTFRKVHHDISRSANGLREDVQRRAAPKQTIRPRRPRR